MRRLLVVFGVMLAVTAAVAPTAGAATPQRGFNFELHAGGFQIQARSFLGSGRVRLLLNRKGEVAYYYAAAQVGPGTVRARFGRLGSLDLRFTPGRGEGPRGCDAKRGGQFGTFRGRITFRGEHDYADVDAGRAQGYFGAHPADDCVHGGATASASAAAAPHPLGPIAETGAQLYGETSPGIPSRFFYIYSENRPGGVRAAFNAFRVERREGMLIERGAQAGGGAHTFEWDLGTGTALVEPPAPFTGRAFYRRGADGRSPRWTGSLRAPILGGEPLRLTGAAFGAHLGSGT
jgi:hypothetical protein